MIKQITVIITILLLALNCYSQEILLQKEVKLKSEFLGKDKKQSFPVVNHRTGEVVMFLLDKKEIKGFSFDGQYATKDSLTTAKPAAKFEILLGHSVVKNNYSLIFSNEKKTKFWNKEINLNSRVTASKELNLSLKGESFLEAISYRDKLYVIAVKKSKSILKIYEIYQGLITRKAAINLTSYKFSKANKSLNYILFNTTSAIRENIILSKIDNKNPISIDIASYPNKIYCYDNTIFISMDLYNDYTKLISINLSEFIFKVKDYEFLKVDCDKDLGIKSNSFLLEDKLFQISGCRKELSFTISNLTDGKQIKHWSAKKGDSIKFKNTPLIQLGGAFNKGKKYRELGETEQILRKMEDENIGISAYNSNGKLEVTIGGYKRMNSKDILLAVAQGGALGAGIPSVGAPSYGPENKNYYSNTTMYNYEHYSFTRSVYFKSALNSSLEGIKGEIGDNAFDKIRKYTNNLKKDIIAKTIFKNREFYVLGYYNKKENFYNLIKFTD